MEIRLDGKVALVTGAARGQGRSHAVALATAGAAVIGIDITAPVPPVKYPMATEADLEATVKQVEAVGGQMLGLQADVRDREGLRRAIDAGASEFGGLDIVVANAGISTGSTPSWEMSDSQWQAVIDVNLTGVWQTTSAAIPHLIKRGPGGSIILISSTAGLRGIPNIAPYVASKHGVVGLTRTLANELARHEIRVNSINPTNVLTPLIDNEATLKTFAPDVPEPTLADADAKLRKINMWDRPYLESQDVSNVVLFLASDLSRYITAAVLPVDLGMSQKYSGS